MRKEKDLSEKILEHYNDVFADIVNGVIFEGRNVVKPEELQDTSLESMYRSIENGDIRGQERDVAKIWTRNDIRIALCGLENQTKPEKYMPMRIMGYEGVSYRDMLNKKPPVVYPVVSLVLYFGEQRWAAPKTVQDVLKQEPVYPDELFSYMNDSKANVCEVSFFSDEEISRFHSDFRVVANFFAQKRRNPQYIPGDKTELQHVKEVLGLLSAVTGDIRYQEIRVDSKGREVHTMCDVAQRLEDRGKAFGIQEGREEGIKEGGLIMLYRLAAAGTLSIDQAVKEAAAYGIKDDDDFCNHALIAGYDIRAEK
ncbi:MAG: Rpn family recombination-promoting nuclease/putative transposase [Bilifractor sp.]